MDFNALVNESLAKIEQEGKVREIVEKRLVKTIESVVDDALGHFSGFEKELKEQVKELLNVNLRQLDLPSYNKLVATVVKDKLDEIVHAQGVEKMKADLEDMLNDMKPEYKLSEVIEAMKKDAMSDRDDYFGGREITLSVDCKYGNLTFIDFDPDSDVSQYRCKYHLTVDKEGRITSAEIRDRKFDTSTIMGRLFGFENLMFKLYAHSTKLIIDEDNVDTYYPGEYD